MRVPVEVGRSARKETLGMETAPLPRVKKPEGPEAEQRPGKYPAFPMPTQLPRRSPGTLRRDLDRVIHLHLRKERGGQEVRAGFPVDDAKQAARWLHRNAIKMYPASRYAWQHSGRFSVVALLACLWRSF